MSLRLCTDVAAADWLVEQQVEWDRLAVRGPLGYAAYARLRFIPDPSFEGQQEGDAVVGGGALSDSDQLRIAVEVLAEYTGTSDDCYFCLWDGWDTPVTREGVPMIRIPRGAAIPTRAYWLFNGDLRDLGDWGADVRTPFGWAPNPAFVWPADRNWCLAADVDPHFATIGASAAAIEGLLADKRIDGIVDDPDREPPYYR